MHAALAELSGDLGLVGGVLGLGLIGEECLDVTDVPFFERGLLSTKNTGLPLYIAYGFNTIFERQVEALANKIDAVVGISTSGNSENVVQAIKRANSIGAFTIGLLGNDGGKLKDVVNLPIIIPSKDTARIQEVHITIGHIICEIIEEDY